MANPHCHTASAQAAAFIKADRSSLSKADYKASRIATTAMLGSPSWAPLSFPALPFGRLALPARRLILIITPPTTQRGPESMSESNQLQGCAITGIGSYVPERVLTNADLAEMVDTNDEWITTRTGIKQRRMAAEGEFTSTMAVAAARKALAQAELEPADLDLIVVATITPDMPFPATACLVQQELGAAKAAAFDLEAACSGFIYALEVGRAFIASSVYQNVLIVGAEKLSSIIDWTDRNTCVLFGDGAGAAVLQRREGARGVLATRLGSDGTRRISLPCPAVAVVNRQPSIQSTNAFISSKWRARRGPKTPPPP